MKVRKIIPLLIITYPENIFYYSMLDINIKNLKFGAFYNTSDDDFIGYNFKPYLADLPAPSISFDIFNPKFTPISIKIKLFNYDGLHNYSYKYGMGVPDVLYIQQDIANNEEVFRMTGKMSEISFDRWVFEFTLKDASASCFIDQPANVLTEDTFQTIKTLGPFDENPLRTFGLLVNVADELDPTAAPASAAGFWPGVPAGNDKLDQLVAWIEHPALYNATDDKYWVGSMVSIIQDPLEIQSTLATDSNILPPCRSNTNPVTGSAIAGSKYTGWPFGGPVFGFNNIRSKALWKSFSLGATAYVIKAGNKFASALGSIYSNAGWDGNSLRGRIWFDINGPELDQQPGVADGVMAAYSTRLIPNPRFILASQILRQYWKNRTGGSKAMGALCNRHVLRITRRPFPENIDSAGKAIPIAYGIIKRAPAVHAIGGKALGDEGSGCADYYIICGHTMCIRVCADNILTGNNMNANERIIQFREVKIWHSLDETISSAEKLTNPAAKNENEYGVNSENPFPRCSKYPAYEWITTGVGVPKENTSNELDPYVMWFNAREDADYRYRCYGGTDALALANTIIYSRQIKLIDNFGNDTYSGIKLRGDDYWANTSNISLNTGAAVTRPPRTMSQNTKCPQYPIRNGLGNSNLYFDFNGEPDFDDGCITGIGQHTVMIGTGQIENIKNPAGLVQNPADVIAHFILKYTKINGDKSKIDWPSFRRARGMLNGWRFSSFLDEVKKGEDIIGQWQSECRSIVYYKNDKFYMRYIDLNPNREVKYVFNDGNINRDSLAIEYNGVGEMYNKFTIQYALDRPHKIWGKTIEYTALNNAACSVAEQMYGATDAFVFECPDILDSFSANILTSYFVELYTKQRISITLSSPIDSYMPDIEQGDVVVVQCSELPNRILFERKKQLTVTAPRFPFIVTGIVPDGESYKYTLLQLFPRATML
jgi:hypothetical protein